MYEILQNVHIAIGIYSFKSIHRVVSERSPRLQELVSITDHCNNHLTNISSKEYFPKKKIHTFIAHLSQVSSSSNTLLQALLL